MPGETKNPFSLIRAALGTVRAREKQIPISYSMNTQSAMSRSGSTANKAFFKLTTFFQLPNLTTGARS